MNIAFFVNSLITLLKEHNAARNTADEIAMIKNKGMDCGNIAL